jgi:predicted ATPase
LRALGHPDQVLVSAATAGVIGRALPVPFGLIDLGAHRLKDLEGADRVFQLTHPELPAEFPALLSLNRVRHNLPVQLSSFVGRDGALIDLTALVSAHQLVTITGFGGMGKTRLALQVAAELANGEDDGVWFVDLSSLQDPSLIPEAIARVLGLAARESDIVALAAHLSDKRLLLICDNVEQLLPEAASSLLSLATAGPHVRLLVTSREALAIRGERVYPIAPLPTPHLTSHDRSATAQTLTVYDAVALFIARVSAAQPGFAVDNNNAPLVAAICDRLDGWPLALELAAARVRLLGLEGLHDRLADRLALLTTGARDLPDRQRTLRETIAWSYDLLTSSEQALLNRLSVFVGPASLDAIEHVCGPELQADLLDTLTSLMEKCLLRTGPDPGWYGMLETIREYAVEQLEEGSEAERIRRRHAAYFRDLFASEQEGPASEAAFTAYVPDLGKAMATLAQCDPAAAIDLLVAVDERLWQFGHIARELSWVSLLRPVPTLDQSALHCLEVLAATRAYYIGVPPDREALATSLDRLLRSGRFTRSALRGCTLLAGYLAERQEHEEARAWVQRSVSLARQCDPEQLADCLAVGSFVARLAGDIEEALALSEEAVRAAPVDDAGRRAFTLGERCRSLARAGQLDRALLCGQESLAAANSAGGTWKGFADESIGRVHLLADRARQAVDHLMRAVQSRRQLGRSPEGLGWLAVALRETDPRLGAALLGAADGLFELSGNEEIMPPAPLLAPARAEFEREFPGEMAAGRRLGWPAVAAFLNDFERPAE